MRTTEPLTITKGERVEWTKSLADYPATLWTLDYRYRHTTGVGINVTATADGEDHLVVIAKTVSDDFTVLGRHQWQAWVTEIADANNTIRIAEGTVWVEAGFVAASTAAVDQRTPAKVMLDTLDAALLAAGSEDAVEYEITTPAGGRRVKRNTRSEAIAQRKYWAAIVRREMYADKMRNGNKWGTTVKVRMP